MRRHWWKILLAASLCLNLGFVASVAVHKIRHARSHAEPDLSLSPETKARFDSSERVFRARMDTLRDELRAERARMMDLVASDDPSPEAIKLQQEKVLDANNRILQAVTDHVLELKRILSPQEQRLFFEHIRSHDQPRYSRPKSPKEEKRP